MPDLTRVRVDRAFRQMRELGVRLRVTDDYREPIDRESGRYFRIRPGSQSIAAGEPIEPGQVVRVRAYELAESFAAGY
jgi:hypothetical protein